ncbi:MAG TPA: hypothetical protein VFT87_01750 [Candidatus Saccharimonadales bacterium]|nr:hypothetical protein [Candidatus Saccharimonadales bacterium]
MEDNNQTVHAPMNGDDALARALNGDMNFEETPVSGAQDDGANTDDSRDDSPAGDTSKTDDHTPPTLEPTIDDAQKDPSNLEKIKSSAISDLRPLLGKLNISDEEKFDTLLLFIRSTDDVSLLGETYEAAKAIQDEDKRAKALLDVIREVSYFTNKK